MRRRTAPKVPRRPCAVEELVAAAQARLGEIDEAIALARLTGEASVPAEVLESLLVVVDEITANEQACRRHAARLRAAVAALSRPIPPARQDGAA